MPSSTQSMPGAQRAGGPAASARTQPVTPAQEELWALSAAGAPAAAVNLSYALAVDGPLDQRALAAALAAAAERFIPLRSTYPSGDELAPEVHDVEFGLLGVATEPEPVDGGAEAFAAAVRERTRPFALGDEPPYRVRVLREPSGRHVLLMTFHHIVADGWALDTLTLFLNDAYARAAAGEPASAGSGGAALPGGWEPASGRGAIPDSVRAFAERLGDASPVIGTLGRDERPSVVEMRRECVLVDPALTARLRELARSSGSSLFGVLLAALESALAVWSQTDDFLVGTLAANRVSATAGDVMGAYYHPLVVRAALPRDATVADALLGVNDVLLRALDDQAVPYRAMRAALRERIGPPAERVPAAMMLLDRHPLWKLKLTGCTLTPLYVDAGGPRTPLPGGGPSTTAAAASVADLSVFAREHGDRLTVSALVPHEHASAADVVELLDTYVRALELFGEAPETPLATLADGEAPAPPAAMEQAPEPALREITGIAPIDALSPVGCWTDERTRS